MKLIRIYSITVVLGLASAGVALRFATGQLSATAAIAALVVAASVLAGSYAFARKLRRRPPVAGALIYYFRSPF